VERNAKDAVLRQKAKYNRAVAYMRKYHPEDLIKAYELFGDSVPAPSTCCQNPIQVLAKVGKANARAHHLIFWDFLLNGGWPVDDSEKGLTWKVQDKSMVGGWMNEGSNRSRETSRLLQTTRRRHRGPKGASAMGRSRAPGGNSSGAS